MPNFTLGEEDLFMIKTAQIPDGKNLRGFRISAVLFSAKQYVVNPLV